MWKKLIITLSFIISIMVHHIFFECLYWKCGENSPKRDDPLKVAELLEVEEPEDEEKVSKPDKEKEIMVKKEIKRATRKDASQKSEIKSKLASRSQNKEERPREAELLSLGQKILKGSARGSFPPLSLDYEYPEEFLKEIYELGGKTYLYDSLLRNLVGEVDMLNYSIKERKDLPPHFSPFKRVIEDNWVKRFKEKVLGLYGGWGSDYQVLLLIPEHLEAKWIGYQLKIFENYHLTSEEVAKVIANFGDKKMVVRQIILKNGKEIEVADKGV